MDLEAFRQMVEQELGEPWAQKAIDLPSLLAAAPGEPRPPVLFPFNRPAGNGEVAFPDWLRTNAIPQKQAGYYAVFVSIPSGDVTADQCRRLAAAARTHGTGQLRASHDQNLVIRWVPGGSLHALWRDLQSAGLGQSGAGRMLANVPT